MCIRDSGKTTLTANLGISLARQGLTTAVLDADFGLRNLDLLLGLENRIVYTAQEVLEETIFSLESVRPIKIFAAGRTDSGVHASGQVAHFDSFGPIPCHRWPAALNGRLPSSIRVRAASEQPVDWHACYSAKYRRYRYCIFNGCYPNLFLQNIWLHDTR